MGKTESLRDTVYQYLMEKIRSGALRPGDKISEAAVCKALSLSRTPAREALIKLEADGLLTYEPNKGFTVGRIDEKSRSDVDVIIGALDALAAALAAAHLSETDFTRMEELADKMDIAVKYRNFPDYFRCQAAFHDVYIGKCGNQRLIGLLDELRRAYAPHSYLSNGEAFDELSATNAEHRRIIALFRSRDMEALQRLLRDHHWQDGADEKPVRLSEPIVPAQPSCAE